MPCAAAAAVTSGSLAAPSSIEYSVWTWRCANESDELLTGGGTPQWSCVPGREGAPAGDRRGRPVCEAPSGGGSGSPDPRTPGGLLRGSDRSCRPQADRERTRSPRPPQARDEPLDGAG